MEKENQISEERIFQLYGDYILNHGEKPKNIYRFAKDNEFEEKDFYNYFTSFEEVEKQMLMNLFVKSTELADEVNNEEYITSKEKLLNVYFIFFENLTMNRSLVLMILGKTKMESVENLSQLRGVHLEYIRTLDFNDWEVIREAKDGIKNAHQKAREEALWLHFISAINFWKNDTSPAFEKTDIFIEKTIDTGFELMDNEPLRKLADLGKFLLKETFKKG